jgi:tetratricopeptide (TPR) repeat protein
MRRLLACLGAAAMGCAGAPQEVPPVSSPASAVTAQAPAPAASAEAPVRRSWFEDDYAGALAEARASDRLLVLDASASWCHTCTAMRATLGADAVLARSVVWMTFDVEKPENAALAARFPVKVLPTFFALDPRSERLLGSWKGGGSPGQLSAFLADAKLAASGQAPEALVHVQEGDRAALEGRAGDAARAYAAALSAAPVGWPRTPDVLVARVSALLEAGAHGECVDVGLAELGRTGRSASVADFAQTVVQCASHLPAGDARTRKLLEAVARGVAAVAEDPGAPLSVDDRQDAYRVAWDARERLGDRAGVRAAAEARLRVIEDAARKATDADVVAALDGARMETLLVLGRGAEAVALLEARERERPKDYNPPYRLARALLELGRKDDALAAVRRAIALGYGARRAQMFGLEAEILLASGKKDEARRALEAQLEAYRSLPPGQRRPAHEKAVEAKLRGLR